MKILLILTFSLSLFAKGIIGQKAPPFHDLEWRDKDGKEIKVPTTEELKGNVVILKFLQSWCPGCLNKGLPDLKVLQDNFKTTEKVKIYSAQTTFEGFGINTEKKIKSIRSRYGLTIPMAHDDGKKQKKKKSILMTRYKTRGTPWYVIIDKKGTVIYNDFHLDPKKTIELIEKKLLK